ncbi:unnamed protein product [Closterium sp. Naga37s-1]|nr:unnamed protein product [Closterium sp. Naga37s-1]
MALRVHPALPPGTRPLASVTVTSERNRIPLPRARLLSSAHSLAAASPFRTDFCATPPGAARAPSRRRRAWRAAAAAGAGEADAGTSPLVTAAGDGAVRAGERQWRGRGAGGGGIPHTKGAFDSPRRFAKKFARTTLPGLTAHSPPFPLPIPPFPPLRSPPHVQASFAHLSQAEWRARRAPTGCQRRVSHTLGSLPLARLRRGGECNQRPRTTRPSSGSAQPGGAGAVRTALLHHANSAPCRSPPPISPLLPTPPPISPLLPTPPPISPLLPTPPPVPSLPVSATRSGLFRSPVSGGVESATSAHGLPAPAVAVRNLVEQAQYAQLCSIMSRGRWGGERGQGGQGVGWKSVGSGQRKGIGGKGSPTRAAPHRGGADRTYPWLSGLANTNLHLGPTFLIPPTFPCHSLPSPFLPDPVFLLSPLGMHSRNLQSDPRCTVVVQIPGWSGLANARATIFGDLYPLPPSQQIPGWSGLANARATIFGDLYPLPPSQQEWARGFYVKRHQHGAAQQWGNFHFYRMDTICDIYFVGGFGTVAWIDVADDIYFVGGFGTVAWIDVAEYVAATPDTVATNHVEHTLQVITAEGTHSVLTVTAEGTHSVLAVTAEGTHSVLTVTAEGTHSVLTVTAEGTHSVLTVTAEGTHSVLTVTAEGTHSVLTVTAEGTHSVLTVTAEGAHSVLTVTAEGTHSVLTVTAEGTHSVLPGEAEREHTVVRRGPSELARSSPQQAIDDASSLSQIIVVELNDRLGAELGAVLAGSSPQQAIDDASSLSLIIGAERLAGGGTEGGAGRELNDRLGGELRAVLAGSSPQQAIDDASFISIDSKGVDIRVRHGTQTPSTQCQQQRPHTLAPMPSHSPPKHPIHPLQFHVQRLSFTTSDAVDSLPAAEAALRRILACPSLVLPNGTPLL